MKMKPSLMIPLALAAALAMVAVVSPPLPKARKQPTCIHAENSLWRLTFTLTNSAALKQLPASKP